MPHPPEQTIAGRATLDAVAERAGVSKATASKVLNHRPGASESTRRRVEQAMVELDYAPTTRPRSASSTGAVTLVFDTLINLYSLRVLEGVVEAAQESGVDVVTKVLATDGTSPGAIDPAMARQVAAKGHGGLLLVTTHVHADLISACRTSGLALVAVDPPNALDPSVVSIGSDHWAGGLQATQHLLDLGHRRIAFVGGSPTNPAFRARYGGYREALLAAGLPEDPALVSNEGMGTAEQVSARMLALPDRPTGVFASNDGDAFGVLRAATAAGLRVPEDLSIVGYDDTYASVASSVLLTTVRTPMHDIGRTALTTLLRMADGEPPITHRLQLATALVRRETTAPR